MKLIDADKLKMSFKPYFDGKKTIGQIIDEQPTVEAQPTDAEREAYIKGYDYGVKDWFKSKTQPTDVVSREQALLALTGMDLPTDRDKLIALFTERIQHLPPVTPQEPKTGHWIETSEGTVCSECGKYPYDDGEYHIANWSSAFCPNCGSYNGGGEDADSD